MVKKRCLFLLPCLLIFALFLLILLFYLTHMNESRSYHKNIHTLRRHQHVMTKNQSECIYKVFHLHWYGDCPDNCKPLMYSSQRNVTKQKISVKMVQVCMNTPIIQGL